MLKWHSTGQSVLAVLQTLSTSHIVFLVRRYMTPGGCIQMLSILHLYGMCEALQFRSFNHKRWPKPHNKMDECHFCTEHFIWHFKHIQMATVNNERLPMDTKEKTAKINVEWQKNMFLPKVLEEDLVLFHIGAYIRMILLHQANATLNLSEQTSTH